MSGVPATPGEPQLQRDLPPLVVVAVLLALACRGHFVKPHGDFYEFRETGHALLRGELPPTFKRAPLFPLLVASVGTLLGVITTTETAPDQVAAGWINAVLLPCNVVLVYLVGRRWFGASARWVALWVALLPTGLYCTAHTLVEPLLLATLMLTIWLTQRGSKWAYLAAALAVMTRYDAAGLIVGVAIAELIRRRPVRIVATRAALALLPLAVWLTLTALTWETRSDDHYLRQMAERRGCDVAWPLENTLSCVFGPEALSTPVWAAEWEPWLRQGVRSGLVVAALLGAGVLLWRRDSGAMAALALFLGYALVHAAFPFRFFRFGYPPAPLVLLAVGTAGRVLATLVSDRVRSQAVRWLVLALVAVPVLAVAYAEAQRLRGLLAIRPLWIMSLPWLSLAGTTLVWATAWVSWRPAGGKVLAYVALIALTLVQTRLALPLLGDGQERINDVRAACWIRDHTAPGDRVLSDSPGLLRLYAGGVSPGRFVGLGGIAAESWPDILAECRRRDIRYIIWHDQVFAEQGAYYIRKWRLERFGVLSNPGEAPGVAVETRYEERPTLWILRVVPE